MAQEFETRFSISNKAKFKDTGFCPIHGRVEKGERSQCIVIENDRICNSKLRLKQENNHAGIRKQFNQYLRQYRECLDVYIPSNQADKNNKQLYAVIKIGMHNYFVPIKRVQEFENLDFTEEEDAFEKFLNRIKASCAYQIAFS